MTAVFRHRLINFQSAMKNEKMQFIQRYVGMMTVNGATSHV